MFDSGATGLFINRRYAEQHSMRMRRLPEPIKLFNIDGTQNSAGDITHTIRLLVTPEGMESQPLEFLVTNLDSENLILGLPWLRMTNPTIDWKRNLLSTNETSPIYRLSGNHSQRQEWLRTGILEEKTEELWCMARFTYSQQLAEKAQKEKPKKTFEEMVPKHYHAHTKVFSESESERLPVHQPWDHAIELKPEAPEAIRTKVYPMLVNEQEELERFLSDNLRKGYIVPSKSPISSPVFFIKKKDGKLHFVQDYR